MNSDILSPRLRSIRARLERLYGSAAQDSFERLRMMLGRYGVGVAPSNGSHERDQGEVVLITYGDSLRENGEIHLQTLRRFLIDRLGDAISTVHILPFFPYSSDDGFSVVDYRAVRPALGSWQDVAEIAARFDLMADLVLNHCSRTSRWFKDYVGGVAPCREYFHEVDPSVDLSDVVRPRSHPLLTRTQTRNGETWVWTTFSADQVDLDFSNPDVLFEFLDILFFYIAQGTRVVRLDAIAYLWKEIGTSCIHLPMTHEVVKLFRDVVDLVAPGVLVLTETNVPHRENVSYFGDGDEAHMVYQFSLPPLLLHAFHTGSTRYLTDWGRSLEDAPEGCMYFNFTASHDGVGVRPLEGIVPKADLDLLVERVRARGGKVSMKRNSDGSESPYELNITYFDAMRLDEEWGAPLHRDRFLSSQSIALALRGVPGVYVHSLTATPNDYEGFERTGHARSLNRKAWELEELARLLDDPHSACARVFAEYTRRLRIRRAQPAFHPLAPQEVLNLDEQLFAVLRTARDGSQAILAVTNFRGTPVAVDLTATPAGSAFASGEPRDLLRESRRVSGGRLELEPWATAWIATG